MTKAANTGGSRIKGRLTNLALGVLAVALLGLAGAGQAQAQTVSKQSQKSQPFADTQPHPCTGEPVSIQGRQNESADTTKNPSGATKVSIRSHQEGQGVGQTTLANYQYQNMSSLMSVTSNVDHFTVQQSEKTHFIHSGQPIDQQTDDFFFFNKITTVVNNFEIVSFNEQLNGPTCK